MDELIEERAIGAIKRIVKIIDWLTSFDSLKMDMIWQIVHHSIYKAAKPVGLAGTTINECLATHLINIDDAAAFIS